MQILPAIDFKDGKVVNLKQGQLEQTTTYSDDPVGMADHWVSAGCERLHLVDLDGAFEGRPKNEAAIARIAANHPGLTIQLGGGIRSPEIIEAYLEAGVDYLIIGTKAVQEPEFVGEMCRRFPGHIIVGLDGLHGMVAINGWKEVTDISVKSLAMLFEADGIESPATFGPHELAHASCISCGMGQRIAEDLHLVSFGQILNGFLVDAKGFVTEIDPVDACGQSTQYEAGDLLLFFMVIRGAGAGRDTSYITTGKRIDDDAESGGHEAKV